MFCLSVPQIMKEWAEADNQSKNLPKSERQALNEVNGLSQPPYSTLFSYLKSPWKYSLIKKHI